MHRRCARYYCQMQKDNICCADCKKKEKCQAVCYNIPEKCNLVLYKISIVKKGCVIK